MAELSEMGQYGHVLLQLQEKLAVQHDRPAKARIITRHARISSDQVGGLAGGMYKSEWASYLY